MAKEVVVVSIDNEGNATVKVECVAGPGCKKVSEAIERALGKVTSDMPTSDMRLSQGQQAKQS